MLSARERIRRRRAGCRRWKAKNREHVHNYNVQYYATHRELHSARDARRRAVLRGLVVHFTWEQFRRLCELHGFRCMMCGEKRPLTVDHEVPLSAGGTNDISNIACVCHGCNRRKYMKTIKLKNTALAKRLRRMAIKEKYRERPEHTDTQITGAAPSTTTGTLGVLSR